MAFDFLSRWRPRHLLGAWTAYWAALAGVTLAPAARAIWNVSQLPEGEGSVSVSYADGLITLLTSHSGLTAFGASASLLELGLWIGVPPLLLWGAWLAARGGDREAITHAREDARVAAPGRAQLGEPGLDPLRDLRAQPPRAEAPAGTTPREDAR